MLKNIFWIGIGGAAGSILRYLTYLLFSKYNHFPVGTLVANILGCVLIGFIVGLFDRHFLSSPTLKIFLVTGFCGGYTTFSTYALESVKLQQNGLFSTWIFYTLGSVIICFLGVLLGMWLAKFL